MASRTRTRRCSRTGVVPFTTFETVPSETCARSAICFMVVMFCMSTYVLSVCRQCSRSDFESTVSLRILGATKTDSRGAILGRRHHLQFTVLRKLVGLREIPDRPLRLIVATPTENTAAGVAIDQLIGSRPHCAHKVHHSKRTCPFRVIADAIRTTHGSSFVRHGYR